MLVRKKDGSFRFCVDYHKPNKVTHKDAYPLPRIDDTLQTLTSFQWFLTLNLLSGYRQVEFADKDKPKTVFCTTEGLCEFKVMPFGLCNALATSQRLMDLILAGIQWPHYLVYIDDVIITGRAFEENLLHLQEVFDQLLQAGLKLQPKKCQFLKLEVQYLGHLVSNDGIPPDLPKIEKIASWPIPTCTKEVQ